MTKKSSRKRKIHATQGGAWKKVSVELAGPASATNHYDDSDKKKPKKSPHHRSTTSSSALDLEAQPAEQVAMFYGLEVLDGSQYTVERKPSGQAQLKILAKEEAKEAAAVKEKPSKKIKKREDTKSNDNEEQPKASNDEETREEEAVETKKKKKKKRKKKKKKKAKEGDDTSSGTNNEEGQKKPAPEKEANLVEKVSKKDDTSFAATSSTSSSSSDAAPAQPDDAADEQSKSLSMTTQSAWCMATGGVLLHTTLCAALHAQQFWTPTPIQAAALAAAILGRRNICGAAPTGSGKTLAFLLPMCQALLEQQQQEQEQQFKDDNNNVVDRCLQALILTPTRELALQIQADAQTLLGTVNNKQWIGAIVGGLAHAKQVRVLDKDRPRILVGTVGRLWELISSRNHAHLNDLSQLRFLVIDEADRMVKQGSFPQLSHILDAVQRANPMDDSDDEEEEEWSDDDDDNDDRMLGLPGIRGEARVQMLTPEILEQLEQQRGDTDKAPQPNDGDSDSEEADHEDLDDDSADHSMGNDDDEDELSLPARPPVHRQTFIYSATLTLPPSANYTKPKKQKGRANNAADDVDGAIAEILWKSRAKGATKIIDLSHGGKSALQGKDKSANTKKEKKQEAKKEKKEKTTKAEGKFRLPPGLRLQQIKCTQLHKDSHLYAYLMTTKDGASGPCLVFCNSVAAVRRVGATLQMLGMEVRTLHANMQQRARIKVIEALRNSKGRVVVVATDVAARGLQIDTLATVVHYDAARNVGTFVHRSGRTARGMGEGAVGCSLSLVSPNEDKSHSQVVRELRVQFENVALDGRLLSGAQERANLATKIVEAEKIQSQSQRDNSWFREKADEMGLELDEDLLDEGLAGGSDRDRNQLRQAKASKVRLKKLLAQPLQTQRFGKFLSTNSAAARRSGDS